MFTFFIKDSVLDVWPVSEYAPVICYSVVGKVVNANKTDSVVCEVTYFKIKHNYCTLCLTCLPKKKKNDWNLTKFS